MVSSFLTIQRTDLRKFYDALAHMFKAKEKSIDCSEVYHLFSILSLLKYLFFYIITNIILNQVLASFSLILKL